MRKLYTGLRRGLARLLWPHLPPPNYEPELGDPQAHRLRELLQRNEWNAAGDLLAQAPDVDQQAHWVFAACEQEGRPSWTEQWPAADPRSEWARLLRAVQGISWAWQARGYGMGETVGADAAELYYARLEEALADLEQAQALNPASPLPVSFAIRAMMGLQYEIGQIEACFEHVQARGPAPFMAHMAMLMALTEKWGHSHAAMFAFARAQADRSAVLPLLIAAAHIERHFACDSSQARRDYARRPDVLAELEQAFATFDPPPRSLASIVGGNHFALAFGICQNLRGLRAGLALVGPWVTRVPWGYYGDPVEVFERFQRAARS